jgi:membrane protease YdiL (CAAX protease family)
MKHLESAFQGKNSFWRYLVMFAAVLVASNTIGAIPLFIAYSAKVATNPEIIAELNANPSNLSVLGYDPNISLVLMLIPFLAGILAFFFLVKPLNNRSFDQTINGTSSIRWNRFFLSAFVWIMISAAYLFIIRGTDPSNYTINNTSFSLLLLIGISFLLIPFQVAFEEVLFRGYLMQGFAVLAGNRWFPLIMTSLLFGIMHAWNPEVKEFGFFTMMSQYVLFGLLFGITTILDDGIEIALGAHTAQNIFVSIFVTNSSSVLQCPAIFEQHNFYPWVEFSGLFVSALVFFIIMKKIYKWDKLSLLLGKIVKKEERIQTL